MPKTFDRLQLKISRKFMLIETLNLSKKIFESFAQGL